MVPAMADDQIRGSVWLLIGALLLMALAILLLVRPLLGTPAQLAQTEVPAPAGENSARHKAAAAPPGTDTRPARPVPRKEVAPPPARAAAPADAEAPAQQRAAANDDAGGAEPSGIALFPPMGTDPPKPGIIVPDDFELPPGYVRHHQVTDDGKPLPPILMFHPDYEWVDAGGHPITLPANHVVPPELAPPGMPIEMLEVPDTHIEQVEPPPPGADFEPADPDR